MLPDHRHKAIRLEARISRLWDDYLTLRDKAEESRDPEDGVAAGRAWARFLCEFLPPRTSDGGSQ